MANYSNQGLIVKRTDVSGQITKRSSFGELFSHQCRCCTGGMMPMLLVVEALWSNVTKYKKVIPCWVCNCDFYVTTLHISVYVRE